MDIIKKSGKTVEFIPNKIKTSIENAADDVNTFLNAKEIELMINDSIETISKIGRTTSSYEVKCIIFETLLKYGYKNIAIAYIVGTVN
ncbi:MAG: ATP cone domain-containing protein [Clostridium sp.]|nr:ATP cone domain-containing protein [Clostridium sp.]